MHYCLMLITKDLPTDDEIAKLLSPYSEQKMYSDENDVDYNSYPISWDWYQIGGRYGGNITYKVSDDDYQFLFHPLNRKKFISGAFDNLKSYYKRFGEFEETDFVNYCGRRDGVLYVDGAYFKDIKNIEKLYDFGFAVLDGVKGNLIVREYYTGEEFIDNKEFDKQAKEILDNNFNNFITIIDYHN